ncbi:MAG: ATP-binding cassette domain-containing protein, partial [Bacteroidota bacterium]|nr:ATP-binding cassette domain-containing protein [Bacteroidota bacterium]
MAFIECREVDFAYLRNTQVLKNVSFSLEKTEHVLLAGTIGAGKSTLLRLMVGLLEPTKGNIHVNDLRPSRRSLNEISRSIGVALQNPSEQIFCSSVREEMMYGARNFGVRFEKP